MESKLFPGIKIPASGPISKRPIILVKNILTGCILALAFFASCTTGKSAVTETPPPAIFPEQDIDSVILRVKQNLPDIKKYIVLDENRDIAVKADIFDDRAEFHEAPEKTPSFEVIYNIGQAEKDGTGGLIIPFSVSSSGTGEARKDTLSWKPQKDGAGLLLAFDDYYTEAWENHFDLLDRYNARVTFFIQGEYCSFCAAAVIRGHDVGFHTINHLNLPKVSREVFDEETQAGTESFRDAGIAITSFAFPYGLSETWMHEELLKKYKILRGYGVTFRAYDRETIREGYSSSKALDNILFKQDEEFEALIDLMLRAVKFVGGNLILPLTTHDISDTADWGIKPRRLIYLLQTANDLQLNFYRYKDL